MTTFTIKNYVKVKIVSLCSIRIKTVINSNQTVTSVNHLISWTWAIVIMYPITEWWHLTYYCLCPAAASSTCIYTTTISKGNLRQNCWHTNDAYSKSIPPKLIPMEFHQECRFWYVHYPGIQTSLNYRIHNVGYASHNREIRHRCPHTISLGIDHI